MSAEHSLKKSKYNRKIHIDNKGSPSYDLISRQEKFTTEKKKDYEFEKM